jgi:hypothetical protein
MFVNTLQSELQTVDEFYLQRLQEHRDVYRRQMAVLRQCAADRDVHPVHDDDDESTDDTHRAWEYADFLTHENYRLDLPRI